jgi:hypothetical protein
VSARPTGWLRLDLNVEQLVEPVAVESGTGPIALAYWTAMLVEAKAGDRFGYIETTAKRFARRVFETRARPTLWQAFIDEGLIELVEGELTGRFVVRMHEQYLDEQTPRPKSDAERARDSRKRREPASHRGERHASDVTEVPETAPMSRSASHENPTIDKRQETFVSKETLPKPRQARISTLTPEQIEQQISGCREQLNGLHPLVEQLVDAMAAENKTGKLALKRALRELWLPIAGLTEEIERGALRHGLEQAVRAGAPNVNYVKKAASSYRPQTRPTGARGGDIIDIEANDGQQQQGGQYAAADLTW